MQRSYWRIWKLNIVIYHPSFICRWDRIYSLKFTRSIACCNKQKSIIVLPEIFNRMNVSKHNIQIIQCIIQYYLAYQKPGNLTNAKGKRKTVVANPEMIQMLELLNTLKVTNYHLPWDKSKHSWNKRKNRHSQQRSRN